MAWEDVKDLFRPDYHTGVMKVDEEACTSCGLCVENCPFRCWEMSDNGIPVLKDGYICLSCFNCMIPCPVDAISIVETYHVHEGYFKTVPHPLPVTMPREPRDAKGQLSEWNSVERVVLERRSVRNYRNTPVPETLIRRVLEAGRFAPSGANTQPWRFVVVTNKALINEINDFVAKELLAIHKTYVDDEAVRTLAAQWEANPNRGAPPDPRAYRGGMGTFGNKLAPVLLGAPAVIFLLANGNAQSLAIAGQNMTLVAKSLGLGSCWVGFVNWINRSPELMKKLGIAPPWTITGSLTLGYPKFRQEGLVPREYRPVTWIKEGSEEQIID